MGFTLTLLIFTVVGYVGRKIYNFFFGNSVRNPFEEDSRKASKPKISDHKLRDAILKENFKLEKVPSDLDAIVIGSGIGGLSAAAILSKAGKKVLVLEQHDQAGGCCHTFIDKGYEFDVGIHYVGDVQGHSFTQTYLEQISDGQITWEPMSVDYDHVVFSEKNEKPKRSYAIYSDKELQKKSLLKHFPGEEKAIEKYYELCQQTQSSQRKAMIIKFLPLWLVKILIFTGILPNMLYFKMNEKSVEDVVNELTTNQTLRDIFSYCFGDYGSVPRESGFPMQATLTNHYGTGASYPIGGASEIALNIIPVIERGGGKVLVRAEVTEIILDSNKTVKGVKVRHGKQTLQISAPLVISSAGLYNTFLKFLPPDVTRNSRLFPLAGKKNGVGGISVFVGLDGSAKDLEVGLKKNYWVYSNNNIGKICTDYLNLPKEKCEEADIPLMFISFPSTKDPLWEEKYPGKTTMAIVTLSNYEWFKEWEKEPCTRRGDDYEGLKKTLGWKMIEQASLMFPKIRDHVDYVNISSPLTNNFYLGASKGEMYGLDHDKSRFRPLNFALLRPTTDIPGLYLSGQDILSCGFVAALYGGILCAQQVLGRNIFLDLNRLHKKLNPVDSKKKD